VTVSPPRAYLTHLLLVMDHDHDHDHDHDLAPPPPPSPPPHRGNSLPAFSKSIPVEIAALPASMRTSFTRVDNTPSGSSSDQRDQMVTGAPTDSDGARELPPPSHDEQLGEAAPPPIPQVPQTMVQFLLVSGRRRSMAFEPETTVGRVKELVWNTWPNGTFCYSRVISTHACHPHPYPPPPIISQLFVCTPHPACTFAICFFSFV
jgi:hypothetical protein